jgi:hypothetical protein
VPDDDQRGDPGDRLPLIMYALSPKRGDQITSIRFSPISEIKKSDADALGTFNVPKTMADRPAGAARYDLAFVFSRPAGDGAD